MLLLWCSSAAVVLLATRTKSSALFLPPQQPTYRGTVNLLTGVLHILALRSSTSIRITSSTRFLLSTLKDSHAASSCSPTSTTRQAFLLSREGDTSAKFSPSILSVQEAHQQLNLTFHVSSSSKFAFRATSVDSNVHKHHDDLHSTFRPIPAHILHCWRVQRALLPRM